MIGISCHDKPMKSIIFISLLLIIFVYSKDVRINIGGSLQASSLLYNMFIGKSVGVITAAGDRSDSTGVIAEMKRRGAISAEWIPIVAPCRRFINDSAILTKIKTLDAIYFTGGYPERLQHCLYGDTAEPKENTPLLEEIKKKKLIAGSSAGSLVQPKRAILTTGFPSSYEVLRTGTMRYSHNGTVILPQNVLVDVHFSERGRQGRLHVLQVITGSKYSFGVDENTGVISDPSNKFKIQGTGGVYVVVNMNNKETSLWHYLTEGDSFDINTGTIQYAPWKKQCNTTDRSPSVSYSIFNPNVFTSKAKELTLFKGNVDFTSYQGSNPVAVVKMSKSMNGMCGKLAGRDYVSFANMKVEFTVRNSKDINGIVGEEPLPENYWNYE